MVKVLNFLSLILLSLNTFAAEAPKPADCDKLLNLPKRFQSAFSMYKDQRLLQPVASFTVNSTLYGEGRFDKVVLDAVLDKDEYLEETRISAGIENFPSERTINVNDFEISHEFGEEYGLKLLLAHYLDRHPETTRVEFAIFATLPVTYSIAREGLARGLPLKEALAATPAVVALRELGFTDFGDATKFTDGPGPSDYTPSAFEIWLDMRKP